MQRKVLLLCLALTALAVVAVPSALSSEPTPDETEITAQTYTPTYRSRRYSMGMGGGAPGGGNYLSSSYLEDIGLHCVYKNFLSWVFWW